MRILDNSAKFFSGWPLLSAYNFAVTMTTTYSTYRFGGCGLPIICGDRKYSLNNGIVAYCRLGNAWRATVVAILPDYCHPSSFSKYNSAKNEPTLIILVQESEENSTPKGYKIVHLNFCIQCTLKNSKHLFSATSRLERSQLQLNKICSCAKNPQNDLVYTSATKRVPAIFCARIQLSTVRKVKD